MDEQLTRLERLASLFRWVFGGLVSLVCAVFALGVSYNSTLTDIRRLYEKVAEVSARVTAIEADRAAKIPLYDQRLAATNQDVATIKNDCAWIRRELESRKQ